MKKRNDKTVIRVVRKRPHHGGSHGGSWKVAYADFVTAMMAFFMVMWIVGMDSDVKDLIEGYFDNPVGFRRAFSAGSSPLLSGVAPYTTGIDRMVLNTRERQRREFEEVRRRIMDRLGDSPLLEQFEAQVDVAVTREGLNIELIETGVGETFFAFGSAELKPAARSALELIAAELVHLRQRVVLEGHTDAAPFGQAHYSNWELSVDRANAARRMLRSSGLREDRISEVRGYADRRLRVPDRPLDPTNRRITILLPYLDVEESAITAD